MAEGLDPVEAGKRLHDHGEQQVGPGDEGADPAERHFRAVQICEALLLAIVTVAAAWAGYSAARWGTESRVDIARSATLRNLATRNNLIALSQRNFDAATFNAWFIAFTLNSPQKEVIAERRFRPRFRVAFNAWLATHPLRNPHAPAGPTYMPQYRQPGLARAAELDGQADEAFAKGSTEGNQSDKYIRTTVFLASVLFLVGISTHFPLRGVRYALVGVGGALLVLSLVQLAQLPGPPG